ncbi:MAG: hypothetical protein WCS52_15535 [bacterium]
MALPQIDLEVDLGHQAGLIRALNGVNLGPLSFNGWLDLSDEFKKLGFPQTRLHDCPYAVSETVDVHSIFPIFDADPQDPNNYRFAITDDYVRSVLDTGSEVIYRLGESIEHHTRGRYFVHPPKDFKKWADICVNIIRHYNEGWGKGFHHGIRYWEIWNEPWNQPDCWTGSDEDYYRLYEVTAKAIKGHDPKMLVGGPSTVGATNPRNFGENFLKHCQKMGAPLDFYSWHIYNLDPLEMVQESFKVKDLLAKYGFAHAESHLNEWNYLPSEGWRFNSRRKDPACIRRAFEEIASAQGSAFDAAFLILMQDCPIDVANFYYSANNGTWGLFDQYGAPNKTYYAFHAFRSMLDTPHRVRTTPNDPLTGCALLAGVADTPKAGILLANFRARAAHFAVTIKDWPWPGKAVCKRYLLDYDRNLTLVGQEILDEKNTILRLCMPAPAFSYLTLTPDGKDADSLGGHLAN